MAVTGILEVISKANAEQRSHHPLSLPRSSRHISCPINILVGKSRIQEIGSGWLQRFQCQHVPSICPATLSQRSEQPQNGASHPPSPALFCALYHTIPEHLCKIWKSMKNELRLVCAAVSVRLFVRNFETCHRCAWYLLSDSSELKALSFWHLSILEEDLDSMALQNSSLNAQCTGILKLTKSNSNSLYLLGFMLSASLSGDCLCPVCPRQKKMQKETALKGSSHQVIKSRRLSLNPTAMNCPYPNCVRWSNRSFDLRLACNVVQSRKPMNLSSRHISTIWHDDSQRKDHTRLFKSF